MRIGEFDQVVAREFLARRETLTTDASRVAARLMNGPDGTTAPAVSQNDTVRVSAEARAVLNGLSGPSTDPLEGPEAVMAAIRQVLGSGGPAELRTAIERLARRVVQLVHPGGMRAPVAGAATHADRVAAVAVRALTRAAAEPASVSAMRAGELVRALVAEGEGIEAGTGLQRAALALYLAAGRVTLPGRGPFELAAARASGGAEGQLPAALHSLAAGQSGAGGGGSARRRRERARLSQGGSGRDDDAYRWAESEVDQDSQRFV